MSNLNNTIWNMPVRYAGGGQFDVLSYDPTLKLVCMSDSLWRELCLTGSWIQDATILRWAELTERLSNGRVKASLVIDCLLSIPDPKRNVNEAKGYYLNLPSPICVWSGRSLSESIFDIDHAMPFTLWRNNDLWNLFPADKAINNQKRDRLPTYDLLQRRRDTVIGYWEGLAENLGPRFSREAQSLLGRDSYDPDNWQAKLFSRFVEAFEITACQRGAGRWEPAVKNFVPQAVLAGSDTAICASKSMIQSQSVLSDVEFGDETQVPDGKIVAFEQVGSEAFKTYLPLVGKIAAGSPFHGISNDSLDYLCDLDWVLVPKKLAKKKRFVVRVGGESMKPTFDIGDLLIFEYHRSYCSLGKVVIANIPEFGAGNSGVEAIKRIDETAASWVFRSDNPEYSPIEVPKTDISYPILGIFIAKLDFQE
jgi:SOS-response transcriptional repressor LexA